MASFPPVAPVKFFAPLLAGARFPDRLVACLGALICIALTSLVCTRLPLAAHNLPLLVAPVGASAVLLFAVPASPLAQPWSIIGGNTVSALVGVCMIKLVPDPMVAAGLAVGGAILAMSLLRCLHPPGGATALTTVIGGPAVLSAGFIFPFFPIALNSAILVALGIVFHRFSQHSYPHRPVAIAETPEEEAATLIDMSDLDKALEELGESFDVGRADLEMLLHRAEIHARRRAGLSDSGEGKFQIIHVMNDRDDPPGDEAA
ncbi:MAG: HPP family protein [Sphingobium sp.]|nr:HPP family protein [Sphingobium sp.]